MLERGGSEGLNAAGWVSVREDRLWRGGEGEGVEWWLSFADGGRVGLGWRATFGVRNLCGVCC